MRVYFSCIFCFIFILAGQAQHVLLNVDENELVRLFDDSANVRIIDESLVKKEKKSIDRLAKPHEKKFQAATKEGKTSIIAQEAANLGLVNLKKSELSNTLQYFEQSLKAFRTLKQSRGEVLVLVLTGYSYFQQKSNKNALDYFSPALDMIPSASKKAAIIRAFTGMSHDNLKDDPGAISDFSESLIIFKRLNDKKSAAWIGNALGESLIKNDENDKAISQLQESYALFEELKDPAGSAIVLRNLGIVQFKNENFESALDYFNRSLAKSGNLQVKKLVLETYQQLNAIQVAAKNSQQATYYANQSKTMKDSIEKMENSRVLSGKDLLNEQEEKNLIKDLMNNDKKLFSQKMTQKDIEFNKRITEAQLERLKKEQTIVQLNDCLRVSESDRLEREMKIQQLTNVKTLQELALSQQQVKLKENELALNTQRNMRNFAFAIIGFILIFLFLLYYRYREKKRLNDSLNKALLDLNSAQALLIQSEKMASLGQLTAGIAHEIQNPLNFVNNFSELSVDLLKEIDLCNNEEERKELIRDVSVNMEKVNHHGKRADSIVKSMLLHSRSERGEMMKTDINALCEEAAKLSWHGFRSSRQDFQCSIEKNFDPSAPPVQLIYQDINRVLLNLLNNAFYSVSEKVKSLASQIPPVDYKPMVSIRTSHQPGQVSIRILDNGIGIPDEVKEKIFNPFFTTKPTGEGTGLGLSLSYDIIKAHHGEIKVDSKKDTFTEFTITLPV